jgi:hypothetical protein
MFPVIADCPASFGVAATSNARPVLADFDPYELCQQTARQFVQVSGQNASGFRTMILTMKTDISIPASGCARLRAICPLEATVPENAKQFVPGWNNRPWLPGYHIHHEDQ